MINFTLGLLSGVILTIMGLAVIAICSDDVKPNEIKHVIIVKHE